MKLFLKLIGELECAASSKQINRALLSYFQEASPKDASWALFFLLANRLPRTISHADLVKLIKQRTEISDWLFEECYQHVGNIPETVALLLKSTQILQEQPESNINLSSLIENEIIPLVKLEAKQRETRINELWNKSNYELCLLINRLLCSGLRLLVSPRDLTSALSEIAQVPQSIIAARLTGKWTPDAESFTQLISERSKVEINSVCPQPFSPITEIRLDPDLLGSLDQFYPQQYFDGLRTQLINVAEHCLLWTEQHENISVSFPELISQAGLFLPLNTVISGELLACNDNKTFSLTGLQRRLKQKQPSRKLQQEVAVKFIASDIIFFEGSDLRDKPFDYRRRVLEECFAEEVPAGLEISREIKASSWDELSENLRANRFYNLILHRKTSSYLSQDASQQMLIRKEASSIVAVLMYVSKGQNRNQRDYDEFTFGVWNKENLVPIAKIKAELDAQFESAITVFAASNTLEKFGPVRTLAPNLIFEIYFDAVSESTRHKSGITLKNPRLKSLLVGRSNKDVDNLDVLISLLNAGF